MFSKKNPYILQRGFQWAAEGNATKNETIKRGDFGVKSNGLVGCGNICDIYFQNAKKFSNVEILACCDIIEERMRNKAQEYEIPHMGSLQDILNNPEIEIVLNLTLPQSHAEVTLAALNAGKNVYSENHLRSI